MVISKKDKKKFKAALNKKTVEETETTKRGRGRPSKAKKHIDLSLPVEKRVIGDGIIDTKEEVIEEITIPELQETLTEEKVEETISETPTEEVEEEIIPTFMDDEEIQEAIQEKKEELKAFREELSEELQEISKKEEEDELSLDDFEDIKADTDILTPEFNIKEDETKEEEEELELNLDNEEVQDEEELNIDFSDVEEAKIEENEINFDDVEVEHTEISEPIVQKEIKTEEIKEEILTDEKVEETPVVAEPVAKVGFMDKFKGIYTKHWNKIIIGAVALVVSWVGVFAFKDQIFGTSTPTPIPTPTPVVSETTTETPEKETPKPVASAMAKVELNEDAKMVLNALIPMSVTLDKGLTEVYDAKKSNETNHWKLKSYDRTTKRTDLIDVKMELNQNLQAIDWVDSDVDTQIKGLSDTDAKWNKISPEEKLKLENNPPLKTKGYNGVEGDLKGTLKASLTIKQGKETKYGYKLNADIEGRSDVSHLFLKNFGLKTQDQEVLDKSEYDKFSLQNKMLTLSEEKENVAVTNLIGEYKTQVMAFNFLANLFNKADIEESDEAVAFTTKTAEVEDETTETAEGETVASNGTTENTSTETTTEETTKLTETTKPVEETSTKDSEKSSEVSTTTTDTTEETTEEEETTEVDTGMETTEEEETSTMKASYRLTLAGGLIKEEFETIKSSIKAIWWLFYSEDKINPLDTFLNNIQDGDILHIHYDTKANKALLDGTLGGYAIEGILGDGESFTAKKDDITYTITSTLNATNMKFDLVSDKEEFIFESGITEKEGIYKTNLTITQNIIKKNGKKINVYKAQNKWLFNADNAEFPVYVKEKTEGDLKGKYEVDFKYIVAEYGKIIAKAFGVTEKTTTKETTTTPTKETKTLETPTTEKTEKTEKTPSKATTKEEVKGKTITKEVVDNSKEETTKVSKKITTTPKNPTTSSTTNEITTTKKVANPIKEVFKEVESEDAKVGAGAVAEILKK